jgi:serine/threonine protein phosphatase PrpC
MTTTDPNPGNMFAIVDGDTRIFGLFDGHGPQGENASKLAASTALKFIRESQFIG